MFEFVTVIFDLWHLNADSVLMH